MTWVWYPIGDMNPAVEESKTAMAKGLKLTWSWSAKATAMGYISAAAALLLMSSVMTSVMA